MIIDRLKALMPLRLGTVASSTHPAGRRAIFYRDGKGQHRPIRPLAALCKSQRQQQPIAMLAPPEYFRALLAAHPELGPEVSRGVNTLPAAVKRMIFDQYKQVMPELFLGGAQEIVWDTNGVHSLRLMIEPETGTYYMKGNDMVDPMELNVLGQSIGGDSFLVKRTK